MTGRTLAGDMAELRRAVEELRRAALDPFTLAGLAAAFLVVAAVTAAALFLTGLIP